jgi:hypothetical protein
MISSVSRFLSGILSYFVLFSWHRGYYKSIERIEIKRKKRDLILVPPLNRIEGLRIADSYYTLNHPYAPVNYSAYPCE